MEVKPGLDRAPEVHRFYFCAVESKQTGSKSRCPFYYSRLWNNFIFQIQLCICSSQSGSSTLRHGLYPEVWQVTYY